MRAHRAFATAWTPEEAGKFKASFVAEFCRHLAAEPTVRHGLGHLHRITGATVGDLLMGGGQREGGSSSRPTHRGSRSGASRDAAARAAQPSSAAARNTTAASPTHPPTDPGVRGKEKKRLRAKLHQARIAAQTEADCAGPACASSDAPSAVAQQASIYPQPFGVSSATVALPAPSGRAASGASSVWAVPPSAPSAGDSPAGPPAIPLLGEWLSLAAAGSAIKGQPAKRPALGSPVRSAGAARHAPRLKAHSDSLPLLGDSMADRGSSSPIQPK